MICSLSFELIHKSGWYKVLEVAGQLLKVYHQNNLSLLTQEQQEVVPKKPSVYKASKIKGNSPVEARKLLKQKQFI